MMKLKLITNFLMAILVVLIVVGHTAFAKENVGVTGSANKKGLSTTAANCNPTTAQAELDINNVRTTVLVGGDMWWNLSDPKYEIPINSGKHSIFAGSLWIGGVDAGGQVKVAAQTYRQTGIDFWAGPIDTTIVNITLDRCMAFDRHWELDRAAVREFYLDFTENGTTTMATADMKSYPGNGSASSNEGQFLAPFFDRDGDGIYEWEDGDYPRYLLAENPIDFEYPNVGNLGAVEKALCNDYLFGDKTIWWVFNDVGNAHTESNSDPIGLEIRAQAFGFQTNDEINNMTFYKYQIINRSTLTLSDTYFGQWVDPDLGDYTDDYVGCDVQRGLGYCYNGQAFDGTAAGYGLNPPAVGVDFFQGPIADVGDGVDNDRDGCIDCTFLIDTLGVLQIIPDNILGEQIIMSKFVYYNNVNQSPFGNPDGFADFYNYLRGIWLDNQPITYGGDGRNPNAPVCDFMFPGDTDPINFPILGEWSEFTAGNPFGDRRFLQSAGAFTLQPGAVNYITTGVVWARTQQGGPLASVELLRLADDKAQALFDNCFKLIDGPNAPDMVIRELDKRLIVSLQNYNNPQVELYSESDPTIVGVPDELTFFDFQGYQVYQLKDANATTADIGNPDRVRLLFQCDIKDGISQLVNFEFDPVLNANVPTEMVNGADNGISHTFEVKQDLFATGNSALVNHKTYYYTVVSYAFNQYKKYDQNDPAALDGQKKPYLAGRNNVKTYSAIPHIPTPNNSGQVFNSDYGSGPRITRIEGQGNGGMILDFANNYEAELLNPPFRIARPEYVGGRGPLRVQVYDPVLVKDFTYTVRFDGAADTTLWIMTNVIDTAFSERSISINNEQVIPEWGLTANFTTVIEAGKPGVVNNAFLTSSIEYVDPSKQWLSSIVDIDDNSPTSNPFDWIRSGEGGIYSGQDDEKIYQTVVGGTWAPYKLTSKDYPGPKWSGIAEAQIALSPTATIKTSIASVDIIITADKSKWSRAAVIEIGGGTTGVGTLGNARAFDLRKSPSIGKDDGQPDNSVADSSMSWFPGYAVNLETGERLNIAFGENSVFGDQNSQDMKWNPNANVFLPGTSPPEVAFGGMHFIYIFGHNGDNPTADVAMYDSCRSVYDLLRLGLTNNAAKRNVWKDAMWTSLPVLSSDFANINLPDEIPTDVKIRIRVARTYRPYATSAVLKNNQPLNVGTTYYVASTPVTHNGTTYSLVGSSFEAASTVFTGAGTVTSTPPVNGFNPMYTFGTGELSNSLNNTGAAKRALDLINVVPNPYYAFSAYETTQLDNTIKITNLPPLCTVTIFTMNGTLVRQYKRDVQKDNSEGQIYDPSEPNTDTSLNWDLKNQKGIPIASGMYLIHVEAPGLGERTLKWFGMIRPIDLDTF